MTVDDESSIYVGGLPYDITDDELRRVFDIFGAVVAVKIINDRAIGGKCYGFVTFSDPRSATQAIREMDGRTIDGRVVKVNEVKTRGRASFNNKGPRRDVERINNDDGIEDRGRDANYDRYHHRDGQRERSLDRARENERGRDRDRDRARDRYVDEDRFRGHNRHMDDVEQVRERKRDRDWERDSDLNIEEQRNNSHHKSVDRDNRFPNRSTVNDHGSREVSLDSFNGDQDQVESKLAVSNQKLEELHEEIARMENCAADKEEEVSQLHEQYEKLLDSLKAAKKVTSHRHMQLEKLHKCYLQVRDYDKRFKNAEEELQSLVNATSTELEREGLIAEAVLTNGRA